jgi:CheY-like chemotaxis protein
MSDDRERTARAGSAESIDRKAPPRSAAILVVDDIEANRELLSERLSERGHLVFQAADGESALELIEHQTFDAVILDVMMPKVVIHGMTGELLGALVVAGRRNLDEPELQLVRGFARQLGDALQLQRLRADLSEAQARLQARRQEMLDRGVAILSTCPTCSACYDQSVRYCIQEGDGVEEARPLLPHRILGRYRLDKIIGQGGMGRLFEAFDEKQIFNDVLHTPRPRLSSQLAGVPSGVDEAFASALARDPADRPLSIGAWLDSFLDELERMPSDAAGWGRLESNPLSGLSSAQTRPMRIRND